MWGCSTVARTETWEWAGCWGPLVCLLNCYSAPVARRCQTSDRTLLVLTANSRVISRTTDGPVRTSLLLMPAEALNFSWATVCLTVMSEISLGCHCVAPDPPPPRLPIQAWPESDKSLVAKISPNKKFMSWDEEGGDQITFSFFCFFVWLFFLHFSSFLCFEGFRDAAAVAAASRRKVIWHASDIHQGFTAAAATSMTTRSIVDCAAGVKAP